MTLATTVIRDNLVWPESPRWHDGSLWISEAFAEDSGVRVFRDDGSETKRYPVAGGPAGMGFLSDGSLVVAAAFTRKLLVLRPGDAAFSEFLDLSDVAAYPNELLVGPDDRIFVSDSAFRVGVDSYASGRLIVVDPDRQSTVVAEDLAFPNGLVLSDDGAVLTVAESFGGRLTRFQVEDDGALVERTVAVDFDGLGVVQDMEKAFSREVAPDGICLDAEAHIWVANPLRPTLQRISPDGKTVIEVQLSQGGIACMLGGSDGQTLYATTGDPTNMTGPSGRIEVARAAVPGAGYPVRQA